MRRGAPPEAGTSIRPESAPNTIVSPAVHTAPNTPSAVEQIGVTTPPASATLTSFRPCTKPSHCPSGEKRETAAFRARDRNRVRAVHAPLIEPLSASRLADVHHLRPVGREGDGRA